MTDDEWHVCDRCHVAPGVVPRWNRDYTIAYTLCSACHREVRAWAGRERGQLWPADERPEVPRAILDRVIP